MTTYILLTRRQYWYLTLLPPMRSYLRRAWSDLVARPDSHTLTLTALIRFAIVPVVFPMAVVYQAYHFLRCYRPTQMHSQAWLSIQEYNFYRNRYLGFKYRESRALWMYWHSILADAFPKNVSHELSI